ncbi:hypothetical protein [Nitrosomonas eutropha]|uniref:hypothetical protein n=1 Tax=Nitrosomonas eutropha TaxID=916 RepID=UPI0015A61242|nr:hypothetical protein [Nitrosomonas eutropha]
MSVLQGMGHSGPFPCISSRTVSDVSQQCGLRHNRFIRQAQRCTGIQTDLSSRYPYGGTTGGTSSDSRKGRGLIFPRNLAFTALCRPINV